MSMIADDTLLRNKLPGSLLILLKIFRECGHDTFFHLVFPQFFFEMNQFTTNSSFQVCGNLCLTLQYQDCVVLIYYLIYKLQPLLQYNSLRISSLRFFPFELQRPSTIDFTKKYFEEQGTGHNLHNMYMFYHII